MVLTLLASTIAGIAAQGTPAAGADLLAGLGYPEVAITGTETGFEVPEEAPAGTVLLTFENTAPFPSGFTLIQLPEGVSMEDLMPPAAASPAAEEAPADEGFPPALYDAIWAGGVFAMPGQTVQAVVMLSPGQWLMLGPDDTMPPGMLNVSGEAGEAPSAPEDAIAVDLHNYQIVLPETIPAGPHVWSITNTGDEPHEMFISKTPERLTVEEAEKLLSMPPDATPEAGLPNPEEFEDVGGVAPISNGQTTMVEMNLEPGHYVAVCFIPAKDSGEPHAMKGMVTIFSVGADGEQVEPPVSPVPDEHAGH
jgi:hypothetical protein